jgi:hypothetical protein
MRPAKPWVRLQARRSEMLRAKLLEKRMGKQTISARQQVSRLGTLLAWHSEKVLASHWAKASV